MDHLLSLTDYIISHISPRDNNETEEGEEEEEGEDLGSSSSSVASLVEETASLQIKNNSPKKCDNNNNQNCDVVEGGLLLIDLPDEIVLYIFTFIDAKTISNSLQFVNWRLNVLCQENRLWKKISRATWKVHEKPKLNWRSYHLLKSHLQSEGSIEWMKIPPIGLRPSRRYQNTSTTVGSKIYLIGGQESALNRFNDIFEFDTETYTFTRVALKGSSQPPSFARHIAVAIGKKIWVHGGFDGHGTYFGVSVFDVEESTWTYIETTGDKPSARTNHAAAAIGKYIYVYGGIKRSTHDSSVLEDLGDMYVLDTETYEWREEQCANMPPPRCGHKMLAMRGKLYLFGGGAGEDWATTYNDINVYDPQTKTWTLIDATGFPDTSTFSCMFALDPFLFVFGGQCKKQKHCSQVVYCYDTLAQSWTTAQPGQIKPEPRDMATMSVCGHSAFLFGGYNQKCFDDVYLLRLTKAANRALETLHLQDDIPISPTSSSPSPSSPSSSHTQTSTTKEIREEEEEREARREDRRRGRDTEDREEGETDDWEDETW
eukprot:Phypoly_transcript_06452.p1 GENE.Phypoly_transcript_06452~~Phypoly_transcript_06452.p1  ORF type:complete len:578 (+),score=110.38 Phypoly_transcript_06452:107-1735(+)